MTKKPFCGLFVEEKPNALRYFRCNMNFVKYKPYGF